MSGENDSFGMQRRDVLKGLGATAGLGLLGISGGAIGSAAAQAPATTARTATVSGNVFLGGDYFELGVRTDGGFGPAVTPPTNFFGSDRGEIGMYADVDGFLSDENDDPNTTVHEYRYDYFVPGTPEERWSVGYKDGAGSTRTGTNGRQASGDPGGADVTGMPTTISAASSGETLAVDVDSTFDGVLDVDQTYRFARDAEFFEVAVTLTNSGSTTLNDVRYQRSVDPDNGQDVGCEYETKNTIVAQRPTSNQALVKAEIDDNDTCALRDISTIPFFYYSTEDSATVSYGTFSAGLAPLEVVYGARENESAPAEGSVLTEDTYVAITFAVGELAPGESERVVFYVGLTSNFDDTLGNIGACLDGRYQQRETDRDFLCDDVDNDSREEDGDGDSDAGRGDDYDRRNTGRDDETRSDGTRDGGSRGGSRDGTDSSGGSGSR